MWQKISAVLLATGLAGCAPEFETTIYMQDVQDVLESGEAILAPAVLRIPQPSEDSCLEDIEATVSAIAEIAPVEGDARCTTVGYDNFTEIPSSVSVVPAASTEEAGNSLLVLELSESDDGRINLALRPQRSLDDIVAALKQTDEFSFMPSLDTPIFRLLVDNDLRGEVKVAPRHVLVDGEPVISGRQFELGRRDSISIELSNVASQHLANANVYVFADVELP